MTASDPPQFRFTVRVYWEDTDAGGVVFYANYLKFFERARTEWLRHLGFEQQQLRLDTGAIFIVTDTAVRYLRPARLDDLLDVTVNVLTAPRGPEARRDVCSSRCILAHSLTPSRVRASALALGSGPEGLRHVTSTWLRRRGHLAPPILSRPGQHKRRRGTPKSTFAFKISPANKILAPISNANRRRTFMQFLCLTRSANILLP